MSSTATATPPAADFLLDEVLEAGDLLAPAPPDFSCPTADGCTAEIFDRLDAIDPDVWQALFPPHWKDRRYYATLAETLADDFPPRYLVLKDRAGEIRALQPLFFVTQDLTVSLPPALRRPLLAMRRLFPRFLKLRLLMVGCVVGDGQTGLAPDLDAAERVEIFTEIDAALARYARRERIGIRLWKDFPAAARRDLLPALCARRGHARLPSLPAVRLPLDFSSFDAFLENKLGKSTRKSLRRKFREVDAADAPVTCEVKNRVTAAEATELHALYERVARRGDIHFEIFPRDYFLLLGQRMTEQTRFFIWRQRGRIVAFAFCTVHGDTLHDNDIGLDYAVAHELHLYHVTFRDLVNWALANDLRWYQSSPFNYEPKLRLRMDLVPLDLYACHRSRLVQSAIRRFAPLLAPTRQEPLLRQFPNFDQLHAAPPGR
ncbi:MAG: GNAT family N-acetyltransferase [Verrucomicrobia bacterium]|nr:GNAT family N-acetyltransferase [Verrucomicrobiota bacterium]